MKANRIPRAVRLRNRIWSLEARYDEGVGKKSGNPYNYCKSCGLHAPQISISGHRKGCSQAGLKKEILHYKRLLWDIEHNGDYSQFYYDTTFL